MKFKNIFFALFGIWLGDFISTIVALSLVTGLTEINPIASLFFSLGWYGYFVFFELAIGIFYIVALIISNRFVFLSKKYNKRKAFLWAMIPIGIFYLAEIFAIVNNLSWIVWALR